ncbi:MAG: glycoside hydrolase family 43 protein [Bacteroidetes bacterium]|nr:glycoside hydrolase family 43 protein [Bacteroidota bacterium]
MKYKQWALLFLLLTNVMLLHAQKDSAFVFCYFNNNGKDGLHLAYSNDGLHWTALNHDSSVLKPTVANDKLMRDPCIIRGADNQFHMVWTVSWNDKGIGYASSKDLIHWSDQQFIPVMAKEDSARNCWAPEITFDKRKKRYMIYWATTIAGKYPVDPKVENGYNHRLYYVTTKDFVHYSKTKLLYDKGFNVIDATIVPNGKQYLMFLKDETRNPPQKNIRIATSKKLTHGFTVPSSPITGKYWAEGPTTLYHNGTWIVYFDKYTEHKYGAVQSTDLKTWTDISDTISLPKGIRHGSIFKVTEEELQRLLQL